MKSLKRILVLLPFLAILLFSCSKKEDANKAETQFEEPQENGGMDRDSADRTGFPAESGSTGVIYVNKAGLYTETDEGKMKWAAEASLGDIALYLGEKKEAFRTDGQKRSFFHVELNGKEYWVQDYSYEPGTVPAFILGENAVLYKSESLAAMTDEIIPQYLIVAAYQDSLEDGKFVKIAAYSSEFITSWTVKEKFVKRELVELDNVNVAAMILAQVAMESRNDTIRAELFRNAIQMNSGYNDVIPDLQTLAEIIIKEENYMKTVSTEKINEKVIVPEDVNLLSIPNSDLEYVRVLNMLKAGSSAVATRRYPASENGAEAEWFYIQSKQKKGWVRASDIKK